MTDEAAQGEHAEWIAGRPGDAARRAVLEAALVHAPFDGWTAKTLETAVREAGIDENEARLAFQGGVRELVAFFVAEADRRMLRALEEMDLEGVSIRSRIKTAVRLRLEQNAEHKEAVRRALLYYATPLNGFGAEIDGACGLWRTADLMWLAIGDRSTDFNYYTKRAILGAVYSSTLLYWLQDHSAGFEETWAFLDRRIADVMRFETVKGEVRSLVERLPSPLAILGALRYPDRRVRD